ncbi:hypothetical protein [Comamonas flocculans]|uniref:IPTL-CTERM sorting domain-containing protein n=1 Tax=Comamonas flocculans TaxID=2597701 RepID=A0A5B8RQV2_9BURK|nr:hypothetical protein [Comamonas flocculans]QEA12010.1 hypothetical protein FOZ74_02585 [Comamonas flocculans]
MLLVALCSGPPALGAPFATTYTGVISHSDIPADAPDGAVFTLTLVLDNGGASAYAQTWAPGQVRCGFWRWHADATRGVAVALDMAGGIAHGTGSASTDAAGALTAIFSSLDTGGPLAWADFDTSGLAPGSAIGWAADGMAQVLGIMTGGGAGSFDDGSGTPAGGIQMLPGRWSAPLPFAGTCDASAVPPAPPVPPSPRAVPALSLWAALLLSGLLAWLARRFTRQRP